MLCTVNMNPKKLVQVIFTLCSNVCKISAVLIYFVLSLEEGESDENDGSDFEILLHFEILIHFETAIVAV